MKISKVRTAIVDVPIYEPWIMALNQIDSLHAIIVILETDNGLIGLGESSTGGPNYSHDMLETMKVMVDQKFGPAILGVDPLDINAWTDRLDKVNRRGHTLSRAAIDMAMFDIIGKSRNLSVAELLGGVWHEEIALVGGVSAMEPEAVAKKAASLVENGYTNLKVKVGRGQDVVLDEIRVKAAREAVGPLIKIRLDCNAAYDVPNAMRLIRKVEKYDPILIEDPIEKWNFDGMAYLTSNSPIPISADNIIFSQYDAFRLISNRAANFIKIKLARVGGFSVANKIIAIAEAAGVPVIVGTGVTENIGMAAEIQLACSAKNVVPVGEMTGSVRLKDSIVKNSIPVTKGKVKVSKLPGLGVELDEEKLKKYTVQ